VETQIVISRSKEVVDDEPCCILQPVHGSAVGNTEPLVPIMLT